MTITNDTIEQLVSGFQSSTRDLNDNLRYYQGTARPHTVGVSVPEKMRQLVTPMGWARTYVNSISDRMDLESFIVGGSATADDTLQQWWRSNDLDELSHIAITEALIHGRSYMIVSSPDPDDPFQDPDTPIIEVESPQRVWADINPRTGRVDRAVRVVEEQSPFGNQTTKHITVYTREVIAGYTPGPEGWEQRFYSEHNLGIVPVIPIVNRSLKSEMYGHSEIFPELRGVIDAGSRLMMNMAAAAELMAIPQRLLFGVNPSELVEDPSDKKQVYDAYMANILAFTDDGSAQQFAAAELSNFVNGLDRLTREAGSITGLPPSYFTFSSENPPSADAIRAVESRLVKLAERKQRMLGSGFEQTMIVAMLMMGRPVGDNERRLEAKWRNAATPTYAAMADAVTKLATAATPEGRPIIPVEAAREELGYSSEKRAQYREWEEDSPKGLLSGLYGRNLPRTNVPDERADTQES